MTWSQVESIRGMLANARHSLPSISILITRNFDAGRQLIVEPHAFDLDTAAIAGTFVPQRGERPIGKTGLRFRVGG